MQTQQGRADGGCWKAEAGELKWNLGRKGCISILWLVWRNISVCDTRSVCRVIKDLNVRQSYKQGQGHATSQTHTQTQFNLQNPVRADVRFLPVTMQDKINLVCPPVLFTVCGYIRHNLHCICLLSIAMQRHKQLIQTHNQRMHSLILLLFIIISTAHCEWHSKAINNVQVMKLFTLTCRVCVRWMLKSFSWKKIG